MICGANTTGQNDEAARNRIANPHADPRLPPREAIDDGGGRDLPGVDVNGIGQPESHEIPSSPLSSLRLDGFQIVVRQHQLGVGEARFALHSKLVRNLAEFDPAKSLHGGNRLQRVVWLFLPAIK